jgi:hypothetical protein
MEELDNIFNVDDSDFIRIELYIKNCKGGKRPSLDDYDNDVAIIKKNKKKNKFSIYNFE